MSTVAMTGKPEGEGFIYLIEGGMIDRDHAIVGWLKEAEREPFVDVAKFFYCNNGFTTTHFDDIMLAWDIACEEFGPYTGKFSIFCKNDRRLVVKASSGKVPMLERVVNRYNAEKAKSVKVLLEQIASLRELNLKSNDENAKLKEEITNLNATAAKIKSSTDFVVKNSSEVIRLAAEEIDNLKIGVEKQSKEMDRVKQELDIARTEAALLHSEKTRVEEMYKELKKRAVENMQHGTENIRSGCVCPRCNGSLKA